MEPILVVENLSKNFGRGKGLVKAVKPLSFSIQKGECFGIIGESGSGKSTIANMVVGLQKPTTGSVCFTGNHMQMIFQNPVASFSPKMTLLDGIVEGARYQVRQPQKVLCKKALEMMQRVGLPVEYAKKTCLEISGGEAQRAAIARALMVEPELLICDEPTSALDVTIQAQIVKLLIQLKQSLGMSYLFISHDIGIVSNLCDRILVLKNGELVECGDTLAVIKNPREEYTRNLIDSIL